MTETSTRFIPSAPPKKKWRWWHIALAILAALLGSSLFKGSPDLKVALSQTGEIQIRNVGKNAIEVRGVIVNDQANCKVVTMLNLGSPDTSPWPIALEVGSGMGLISFCRAVRVSIDTSAGSAAYEFK